MNPHGYNTARFSRPARRTVFGYFPCAGKLTRYGVQLSPTLLLHPANCQLPPGSKHAPRDSNPDQLVWNQRCCHYTRDMKKFSVFSFQFSVLKSRGGRNRTDDLLIQSQVSLPTATTPQKPNVSFPTPNALHTENSTPAEAVRLELTSRSRSHLFSRQAPHPAGWLPLSKKVEK